MAEVHVGVYHDIALSFNTQDGLFHATVARMHLIDDTFRGLMNQIDILQPVPQREEA